MKRTSIAFLIVIASCVMGVVSVFLIKLRHEAKRESPPLIEPIEIAGIQYRVPNTYSKEGILEAWDAKSAKFMWQRKLYSTVHIPLLFEEDNQWNFIKSMKVGPSTNELTLTNEVGNQYIFNTASTKLRRVKASEVKP